ncbi:MAG: hypothetical protein ABH869_07665 [Candidatus Omnitrophota bacterium]
MIELNLLPKEFRKKKQASNQLTEIPVVVISACIVVFVVLIHILLVFFDARNNAVLKKLEQRWDQIQPQSKETEELSRNIVSIEKKVIAIREIAKPGFSWARVLSGLNESIIDDIWLSGFDLSFSRGKGSAQDLPSAVNLTGYAFSETEKATSRVAKFIASLKNNEDFSRYFEDIEVQNIRNTEFAKTEVMIFRLICRVKSIDIVSIKGEK